MHGIIFVELQKYVTTRLGEKTWATLLADAGLRNQHYLPSAEYPDEQALALVGAACKRTHLTAAQVLEDFGEFIAPDLLRMYKLMLDPSWDTLDIVANTERTIHTIVRLKNPGADPPKLLCRRDGPNVLMLTYASPRRLCAVAKGIVRGIARERRESVTVNESACMLSGAPACEITIVRR